MVLFCPFSQMNKYERTLNPLSYTVPWCSLTDCSTGALHSWLQELNILFSVLFLLLRTFFADKQNACLGPSTNVAIFAYLRCYILNKVRHPTETLQAAYMAPAILYKQAIPCFRRRPPPLIWTDRLLCPQTHSQKLSDSRLTNVPCATGWPVPKVSHRREAGALDSHCNPEYSIFNGWMSSIDSGGPVWQMAYV